MNLENLFRYSLKLRERILRQLIIEAPVIINDFYYIIENKRINIDLE